MFADCSDLGLNETMTCQELLAFSVAFSAALPTSQTTLESFYTSLARNDTGQQDKPVQNTANYYEDFSCCYDLYQNAALNDTVDEKRSHSKVYRSCAVMWKVVNKVAGKSEIRLSTGVGITEQVRLAFFRLSHVVSKVTCSVSFKYSISPDLS